MKRNLISPSTLERQGCSNVSENGILKLVKDEKVILQGEDKSLCISYVRNGCRTMRLTQMESLQIKLICGMVSLVT